MKNTVHISDLNFEHNNWKQELAFQKDELKIFQNRLDEVVVRWTDKEVLRQVEQFQNTIIRLNEVHDILLHEVNEHVSELSEFAQDHPVAIDHVHFTDHSGFRDKMDTVTTSTKMELV